jgi:hypothetical protein
MKQFNVIVLSESMFGIMEKHDTFLNAENTEELAALVHDLFGEYEFEIVSEGLICPAGDIPYEYEMAVPDVNNGDRRNIFKCEESLNEWKERFIKRHGNIDLVFNVHWGWSAIYDTPFYRWREQDVNNIAICLDRFGTKE